MLGFFGKYLSMSKPNAALSQKLLYPKCHGSKFAEINVQSVTSPLLIERGWLILGGQHRLLQSLLP